MIGLTIQMLSTVQPSLEFARPITTAESALVSDAALQVIDIARQHGAIGWKVNGAGGDGGPSRSAMTGGSRRAGGTGSARAQRNYSMSPSPVTMRPAASTC